MANVQVFLVLCVVSIAIASRNICNKRCSSCVNGRCRECHHGWYGHNCNSKCENCWLSKCHKHSGICYDCKPGLYKNDCGILCPEYCRPDNYGDTFCHRENGTCLDGCKRGWWGDTCNHRCNEYCKTGICRQEDGQCLCRAGWWGTNCDKQCSDGCLNGNCNYMNGHCEEGCKNGISGARCETYDIENCINGRYRITAYSLLCTDGCSQGYTSDACNRKCSRRCQICQQFKRICEKCKPLHYGQRCRDRNENCQDKECDVYGRCLRGCVDGFYGKSCDKKCPFTCMSCDRNGHTCTRCMTGWTGDTCEEHVQDHMSVYNYKIIMDAESQTSGCGGSENLCSFLCLMLLSMTSMCYILKNAL